MEQDRGERGRERPRRRKLLAVALLFGALLTLDLLRAPENQLTARALLAAIDTYQATLSPVLGHAGVRCRFHPSCSHYAEGAIKKDGALIGLAPGHLAHRPLRPLDPGGDVRSAVNPQDRLPFSLSRSEMVDSKIPSLARPLLSIPWCGAGGRALRRQSGREGGS